MFVRFNTTILNVGIISQCGRYFTEPVTDRCEPLERILHCKLQLPGITVYPVNDFLHRAIPLLSRRYRE